MLPSSRWALRLSRQAVRRVSTNKPRIPRGPRNTVSKRPLPSRLPRHEPKSSVQPKAESEADKVQAVSSALHESAESQDNNLVAPVHIPEDPHGILKENHPAMSILANSSIVVQRQLEMMNVVLGFEQANRYVIMDGAGNHIGYLAEQEHGLGNTMARQLFRTHRSFTTHVFDRNEREVLRFHRPFSWISSRIRVHDAVPPNDVSPSTSTALQGLSASSIANQTSAQISPLPLSEMRIIGEAQQEWAPLRRKYNLFLARNLSEIERDNNAPQLTSGDLPLSDSKALQTTNPAEDSRHIEFIQFARVSEPFLSWDFTLLSSDGRLIGSVNRNFVGFAREIFTDTGVYALRMDAAGLAAEPSHLISRTGQQATETVPGMTLDQRAVMLATAVSIDFDYFSRHSRSGGMGFMPLWWPMGEGAAAEGAAGGAAAGGAAAGGAAGEVGAAEAGAGAVGNAARGSIGMGEGAVAGAGTMAGYEAMQRGVYGNRQEQAPNSDPAARAADDASPTAQGPYGDEPASGSEQPGEQEDVWGENFPWDDQGRGGGGPDGGGGGGGGGGDGGSWFSDFFSD